MPPPMGASCRACGHAALRHHKSFKKCSQLTPVKAAGSRPVPMPCMCLGFEFDPNNLGMHTASERMAMFWEEQLREYPERYFAEAALPDEAPTLNVEVMAFMERLEAQGWSDPSWIGERGTLTAG